MTREEFKNKIRGHKVEDLIPYDQDRWEPANILPWPETIRGHEDDVIYYASNEDDPDSKDLIATDENIEDVMDNIYTVRDILSEAGYNVRLAKDIYHNLSWQCPCTEREQIEAATYDEEALHDYGEDWETIEKREHAPNVPFLVSYEDPSTQLPMELIVYGRSEDTVRVWMEDFYHKDIESEIFIQAYDDSHGNPKGIPIHTLSKGWLAY